MKKFITLIILMMFMGTAAKAQLDFGAVFGPGFATFGGKDQEIWGGTESKAKMQLKFHVGILASYRLNDNLSIEPRLLYSLKGPKYSGNVIGLGEMSYKKLLSYLDIPVLLKYNISEDFSVMAGPQLSFLLSAKVDDGEEKYDAKDEYESTDFALVIGAGYMVTETIGINLFYDMGMAKIAGYESYSYDVKNNVIKVSIIYLFKRK